MQVTNQQFSAGVYIVFARDESAIAETITNESLNYKILNLASPDSIKIPTYFKKEKLEWTSGIVSSHSQHPNTLLSSAIHLLQKTDCLIIGTSGLSDSSLIQIINFFIKDTLEKWLFFIDSTGDYLVENPIVKVTECTIKDIEAILKRTTLKCSFPKFNFKDR